MWSRIAKVFLTLTAALAVFGLFIGPQYQLASAILGAFSGFISSCIIPGFGLEGYNEKLIGIRNRWIDVRNGLAGLWLEFQSASDFKPLEEELARWLKIDSALEQLSDWLPESKKFQERATDETIQMLCKN